MSTIFNQLVKHRIEQFNNCNPEGSGKHDVKPGDVVISELHPTPVGVSGETMFCDANWRPNPYAPFLKGQTFKMNTDVLYNKVSFSIDKTKPVDQLVGRLVSIKEPAISHFTNAKGKTFSKYNVKWSVIGKDPEMDTVIPKSAGMYVLADSGPGIKTIGDAMENFYEQHGDYLRDAAYDEGFIDYERDDVDF